MKVKAAEADTPSPASVHPHPALMAVGALIARLTQCPTELRVGFALVGHQHRLVVAGQDYFIDLLFFRLGWRRFLSTSAASTLWPARNG